MRTSEPGLHESWGELGLGLRGAVNRGCNCPRPLDVKVCFHAQYGSYRCKEKCITTTRTTGVRLTAASMIAATPGPVPSSTALHLGPEKTSGPAPVPDPPVLPGSEPLCARKMSESPDPFTRPWSWVCPLPTCTKYTCSSTVWDLRFFPRLDPGTFPFQILRCSPRSLWSPRPPLYSDYLGVGLPASCSSRCDFCSCVYCHVPSVWSCAASPQSRLFILWLLLISSTNARL